jgi:signal transduction histidine kinase
MLGSAGNERFRRSLSSTVATPPGSRRLLLAAAACASVATVTGIVVEGEFGLYHRASGAELWLAIGPGMAWLVAGLVGWALRPANRAGPLITMVGLAFFGPSVLAFTGEPLLFTLAMVTWGAPFAFAAHLYLIFPENRAGSAFERLLVVFAYLVVLLADPVHALFRDPVGDFGCPACPENLVLLHQDPDAADAVVAIGSALRAAMSAAVAVVLIRRWRAATPTARRALAPVLGTSLLTAVVFVPYLASFDPDGPIWDATLGLPAYLLSTIVPLGFLVGLLRTRLQQGGVADLIVELGTAPPAARIRQLLARALGDPSVELAFWRPDAASYVDPEGLPTTLPEDGGPRATSIIERNGTRLGALVHDRSLLQKPELLDAVEAAAGLALDNARLHAELRAQLREVRASRGRIVDAGDQERRRIERNLHDGAQQHLLAIRLALTVVRRDAGRLEPQLAEIDGELGTALEELRTLARGLHPPILTEQGVGPALETLARRAAIPVEVGALPSGRLPPAVETAAYYVASEALANAVKHAHASHVRIDVTQTGTSAVVEIVDDGTGGADPRGSGLRGLRDRVEALDGSLTVASAQGQGTMLRAELPCA